MLPLDKGAALRRIVAMTFTADYPGAIVVPADRSNWRQLPNTPQGWVLHTPEEPADDHEVTPYYFQTPGLDASTHYYLDSDGDVYQMVQERWSPIANGVKGKPYPSWANPRISLNGQSLNVEIEGFAASIQESMPVGGRQFTSLIKLIRHRAEAYGIPLDREHIIGHYQVANDRSDPGAGFPWDALMAALKEEEDMKPIRIWCAERLKTYLVGPFGAVPVVSEADDKALEALYGPHATVLTGAQVDAMAPK